MVESTIFYSYLLMGFIFINFFVYFCIQFKATEKIFRKLCTYWLAILLVVICESVFTQGKLALSLVFLVNFLPISMMANFLFEMYDYKFNVDKYLPFIPLAIIISWGLNQLELPFFFICLPVTLMTISPIVEFLHFTFISKQSQDLQMEKIMVVMVASAGIFSCFYYCIYRYNPTPIQYFIGFGSAAISYVICSLLLTVLCIKIINRKRTQHLEDQVNLRTQELSRSKQEKEELLRVLVHDISNPIQAMMLQLNQMKKRKELTPDQQEDLFSDKIYKNVVSLTDIISHVREYESILSGKKTRQVTEVPLHECLKEIECLFSERFKEKNIKLYIHNKLPQHTKIKVDRVPFVHSVASNLVSNALKFSRPHSEVTIAAYDKNDQIIIEVIDNGIGMSKQILNQLFDVSFSTSRQGTMGEVGTGFGMPIVKAYASMFGAHIEVSSSQEDDNCGTKVALIFPNINQNPSTDFQTYLQ